jgi:hypothetical protein
MPVLQLVAGKQPASHVAAHQKWAKRTFSLKHLDKLVHGL